MSKHSFCTFADFMLLQRVNAPYAVFMHRMQLKHWLELLFHYKSEANRTIIHNMCLMVYNGYNYKYAYIYKYSNTNTQIQKHDINN